MGPLRTAPTAEIVARTCHCAKVADENRPRVSQARESMLV